MATELSVEAVRDFIILNDGKVKNNILVTHFRKFLNDPQKKAEARQTFKDCVNEVAVVKTENGEKYVQLKKKYRTGAPLKAPDSPLNLPPSPNMRPSPNQMNMVSSFDTPLRATHMDDRPPSYRSEAPDDELPPSYIDQPQQGAPPPYQPPPEVLLSVPPQDSVSEHPPPSAPSQTDPTISTPQRMKRSSAGSTPAHKPVHMDSSGVFKVPLAPDRRSGSDLIPKPQNMGSTGSLDARHSNPGSMGSLDPSRLGSEDTVSIMQSEASMDSNQNIDFDDDRGGSTFAMDPLEKQWMMTCAKGSMLELRKLLNKDPNLAEKKDFVFGYTALHWAAKKGSVDLVRMFGDCGVDVNAVSNGGFTAMHLAAMHGHEKVVQILVEEYDADPLIRNFSGKQARHYLKTGSISLPMQKLLFGNDGNGTLRDFAAGLRPRLDTVRKSKRLGNAISGGVGVLGALVRGKAPSNEDVSSVSSNSPHISRKGSFSTKGKKKKHRKNSREERPSISIVSNDDSEYGFAPRRTSGISEMRRGPNSNSSPVLSSKHRNRGDSVYSRSSYTDDYR